MAESKDDIDDVAQTLARSVGLEEVLQHDLGRNLLHPDAQRLLKAKLSSALWWAYHLGGHDKLTSLDKAIKP